MKVIPPQLRALWIACCRRWFGEAVIRMPVPPHDIGLSVGLHMVVSSKTWKMGLMALRSLEFQTGARWSPVIHEDGSLSDADAEELAILQPDATLIRRRDADALVSEGLASWPVCRENRARHNWFIKFFDTFLLARHPHYIVLDSDIVFYRAPRFLQDWAERGADTLHFMRDTRETYASPRADLEAAMGFPFWESVNSGICLMFKPAVSLDLAEQFLTRCAAGARHYKFLEQTLFALTGSAWNRGGCLPPEYEISWGNFRSRSAVCRHYVGPFKDDLLWVEGAASFWLDQKLRRRRT